MGKMITPSRMNSLVPMLVQSQRTSSPNMIQELAVPIFDGALLALRAFDGGEWLLDEAYSTMDFNGGDVVCRNCGSG